MAQTAKKNLYLYIDYHNVLDSGRDKLREMAKFLRRLNEDNGRVYKTLTSYGGQARNEETIRELCAAGVINLLDAIVFTRQRTSPHTYCYHHREEALYYVTYACRKYYSPRPVTHEHVNYTVFTGGKDEYIRRGHFGKPNDAILFVDDKATTLRAACEPGTWTMAPKPFGCLLYTSPSPRDRG